MRILIDLPTQQLLLHGEDGATIRRYAVSTALNGAGERNGSGCTPRGRHVIRARIGAGCPPRERSQASVEGRPEVAVRSQRAAPADKVTVYRDKVAS